MKAKANELRIGTKFKRVNENRVYTIVGTDLQYLVYASAAFNVNGKRRRINASILFDELVTVINK